MTLFVPKVSLKVDLTENRDFSNQEDIRILVVDSNIMTDEEYFLMSKYENIFGKKHVYINRAESIFNKEKRFEEETQQYCQRCGKLLRIPWKRKHNLCLYCDYELERQERCEIPWKETKIINISGDNIDVLRLR